MAKDYTRFAKRRAEAKGNKEKEKSILDLGDDYYDIAAPFRSNGDAPEIVQIPVNRLVDFQGESPFHSYKDTEKFTTLLHDIEENGIITPIIVREIPDGQYEVIAGMHRSEACRRLKLATIPAVVYKKEISDDKIMTIHLTTNLMNGREELSLSEKIKAMVAYDQVLERKRGSRNDLHSEENGKYDVYQHLAEVFHLGNRTTAVQYLKAGQNIPDDILKLLDKKAVSFSVVYQIMKLEDDTFKDTLYQQVREGKKLTQKMLDLKIKEHEKPVESKIQEETTPTNEVESKIQEEATPTDEVESKIQEEAVLTDEIEEQINKEHNPVLLQRKEKNDKFSYFLQIDIQRFPKVFQELPEQNKKDLIYQLIENWAEHTK